MGTLRSRIYWRILDELGSKRSWSDVANYGNNDLSSLPAYGQYDVSLLTSLDVMENYDYLIFTGWNTITDEITNDLKNMLKMVADYLCQQHT